MSDKYYICKNGHEMTLSNALWSECKKEYSCSKCGESLEEFKEEEE